MAADDEVCEASVNGCSPDEFDHSELITTVYGMYVHALILQCCTVLFFRLILYNILLLLFMWYWLW